MFRPLPRASTSSCRGNAAAVAAAFCLAANSARSRRINAHSPARGSDEGFPVREINVGERSNEPEKYVNLKAENYWALRTRSEEGKISGLTDEQTIAQLVGIRTATIAAA